MSSREGDMPMNDPVSSAVQEVVDLYTGELSELRFGDLEGSVLARATDEVKAIAIEVTVAEATLEAVRARLNEKQEALFQKAQRALAYARVYAEGQPELSARIDQIAMPRAARRTARIDVNPLENEDLVPLPEASRRRGRPRKVAGGATLLPLPTDEPALDPVATTG